VPNDQVRRRHNLSPDGNAIFVAKGSVRQYSEDMKDFNHKHEPQQLKERSSTVNDLLGAFYTILPRADRHHVLIESTPQCTVFAPIRQKNKNPNFTNLVMSIVMSITVWPFTL